MSIFSGMRNTQIFERGQPFLAGTYDAKVVKCITKETQNSGLCLIVEFDVLASSNPSRVVGSRASWIVPIDRKKQITWPNIKAFLVAVLGKESSDKLWYENEFNPQCESLMEASVSDKQPLTGQLVHLEAVAVKTKAGGDFTRHDWTPYRNG